MENNCLRLLFVRTQRDFYALFPPLALFVCCIENMTLQLPYTSSYFSFNSIFQNDHFLKLSDLDHLDHLVSDSLMKVFKRVFANRNLMYNTETN